MENTLEVRWFVRGMPPAVVQRWFKLECLGKFKQPEVRQDWYAYQNSSNLNRFSKLLFPVSSCDAVNLKLRQNNLELKLRAQDFGTYGFGNIQRYYNCEGKIEQWSKLDERELRDYVSLASSHDLGWVGVNKERSQKIEQGTKIELTHLEINSEAWWTVAFEMSQNNDNKQQDSCFREVIEKACQAYRGPKLSASNSYGYSRWLLEFAPKSLTYQNFLASNF